VNLGSSIAAALATDDRRRQSGGQGGTGRINRNSAHECSRRVIRRGPIEDTRGAPSHVRARRRVETSSGARRARDSRVQTRARLAALDQERLLRAEAFETRAARSSSARISAGVLMVTLRPVLRGKVPKASRRSASTARRRLRPTPSRTRDAM